MTEQPITVGRVVHFFPTDDHVQAGTPYPAITTAVQPGQMACALTVFPPACEPTPMLAVPFSDEPTAGCWTWQPVQRNQRPDVGAPRPRAVALDDDTVTRIARVAWEVNRAYQLATSEPNPSPAWEDAPEHMRASVAAGINPVLGGATPEESHALWCEYKRAEGWVYGPEKDVEARIHPCLVPYDELPLSQRVKDHLYGAVVRSLAAETL